MNPYREVRYPFRLKKQNYCGAFSGHHPTGIGKGYICSLLFGHYGFHRCSDIQWSSSQNKAEFMKDAWTDYPITYLGDAPHQRAPIRKVRVVSWDGDKYAKIHDIHSGYFFSTKVGYLYSEPGRFGEVPNLSMSGVSIDPLLHRGIE